MKPNALSVLTAQLLHSAARLTNKTWIPWHLSLIPWAIHCDSWRAATPLCAFTALPQGQRGPWCQGRASSGGTVGKSELSRAGRAASLGLSRPSRVEHFQSPTGACLVIPQRCLFSDPPVLPQIVRWNQVLHRPRSERLGWMRLWRKNCTKIADWSPVQH